MVSAIARESNQVGYTIGGGAMAAERKVLHIIKVSC